MITVYYLWVKRQWLSKANERYFRMPIDKHHHDGICVIKAYARFLVSQLIEVGGDIVSGSKTSHETGGERL